MHCDKADDEKLTFYKYVVLTGQTYDDLIEYDKLLYIKQANDI